MEIYSNENEQLDAVRGFFAENGKALAIGIVVGIGALFGWNYWQSHQTGTMINASANYQELSTALASNNSPAVAETEKFIQSNSNSYGVMASLELASYFVANNKFAEAEKQLQAAQAMTKDTDLLSLIHLRLARIQLQENQADEALKTVATVTNAGWSAMADEVRGDILLKKGDNAGAKAAYQKALEATNSQTLQSLLRMKLSNLSS